MVESKESLSIQKIWDVLSTIPDPDIPVISITDLGIIRDVKLDGKIALVTITPTYSGCPAMHVFKEDIKTALLDLGCEDVHLHLSLSPPWTTDWLNEESKAKMRAHGIATPDKTELQDAELFSDAKKNIACPHCSSNDTKLTSQFGSTACKALWYCNSCQQPFEYFKPY